MYNAIDYGIAFNAAQLYDDQELSEPGELIAITPYLLGCPIPQDNLILFGCHGHLPVTCLAMTFGPGLDENVTDVVTTWRSDAIDNLIVIGYCDRSDLAAIAAGGGGPELSETLRERSNYHTALLCVEEDGSIWINNGGLKPRWVETEVEIDLTVEAMHAGYHAWMPLGVIDSLSPLEAARNGCVAEIDAALREQHKEPEHGWDLVDRVMAAPGLPSAAEAARLGAALLDCRVLEHAMSKLICADDPRLDVWFWTARTLGFGPHFATGMAGLAAYRVNAGPRARQAWEIQEADTPDQRTRALHAAIGNRERLGSILGIVEQRRYRCERPCCTRR